MLGGLFIQNYRINERIRAPKILLINEEGKNLGILELEEGLKIAEESGLDIVEVAPDKEPPVCRLLDYGKLKYQQKKKANQKKKAKLQQKELRITQKIGEHDFQVKLKQIAQFLDYGDKVLISINFRGREMAHLDRARELMKKIAEETKEIGKVEKAAKLEGRRMTMVLAPSSSKK